MADVAYMRSPYTGEVRAVDVSPESLSPLMSQGWMQAPAPADTTAAAPIEEEHPDGQH